ncbi:MAG: polysaccharide pyruvyl transferase CsaB [Thermosynechococcaceae cyanobacterium]
MQAILCGYYGYGNGGDEALLATLLQCLPQSVAPVVLSGNPAQTEALHGVPACDRTDPVAVLNLLRRSQAFIWGGGSLIQDSTSALSPWYYCGLMVLARLLGLKTIAWAQGVGPLRRPLTQWIAQQAFQRCMAISVRDPGSLQWVQRWGRTAVLAPDPVWALEAQSVSSVATLPGPRIAVVLRSHPQLTPERLDIIRQALWDLNRQTQAFIVLVPFQLSQDLMIAQTLHQQLPDISEIIRLSDPRQLKGVFQGVDGAIAMRLHGLIMAAAEGCRCFGISYDPKVQRLIEEIQCPGVDVAELPEEASVLVQQWRQLLAADPSLSVQQRQQLREQALQHQALLADVLLASKQHNPSFF